MRQTERARLQAMRGYPCMQLFLDRAMSEDVSEALLAVEEKREALEEAYQEVEDRIDYSLLPGDVDGEKLRRMLAFTIRGLMAERFQNASCQPEMLYQDICDYIDMTRRLVYRPAE